jgi:hypothetical protein
MRYNHIGIPTSGRFEGEIDLPHLRITVSDHALNPAPACASRSSK